MVELGTSQVFEVGDDPARRRACAEVLKTGSGKLIDTAPSYETAEGVVGNLLAAAALSGRVQGDRPRAAGRTPIPPGGVLAIDTRAWVEGCHVAANVSYISHVYISRVYLRRNPAARLPASVVHALELKEGDEIEIHVGDKREFGVPRKPGR